jgi:hypothetical protein
VANQAPAAGNERPDDVITLRLPNGTLQKLTRTDYHTGLSQGLWRADWVENAEPGSVAAPTTTVNPPPSLPAPTSGTGISPYPGAPVNVPYPTPPTDQSLQSVPDFAVLQTPNATAARVSAPAPYAQPPDYAVMGGGSTDLHQQAAATVPWRMTPEQLEQYRRAGVPEDAILAVPGGW